jgi:hypothetical protein
LVPTLHGSRVIIAPAILLVGLVVHGLRNRQHAISDDRSHPDVQRFIGPLLITIALYYLVQTLRAVYIRAWYNTPFVLLLFIPIARAIDTGIGHMHTRPARVRWALGSAAAGLVIAGYAAGYVAVFALQSRDEVKYLTVIPAMHRLLPPGTRAGAWNAGIYGYFFEHGDVVNLDGVVNNAAYDHIVNHSLRDYCRSVGITYIVDDAGTLRDMAPYWTDSTRDIGSDIVIMDSTPIPTNDTTVIGRIR